MKILVSGADGYLGTGIVKQLCDDGAEVVATDYCFHHLSDSRAKKIPCDIFSIKDPFSYFGSPDVLLHLAWRNGFVHNHNSHIEDLPLHFHFIKKMIEAGCSRISVMGTMHEVGYFEGSIKEDTPTHPESLYGISKDALRNMVKVLCNEKHVNYQWLRGYYIVGNSDQGSSIFSKICLAEKSGQSRFPFTLGINQWDFIDYDEFCLKAASTVQQDRINGIINICSGRPEKLRDRVERFIEENHFQISLDYGKFPDRSYDSKAVWGDDSKINEIMLNRPIR